ncbi:hypothetical protein Pcinc_025621 [Petrolisthes cinctipes]|uniref:Uncharacterized protein n=1 Tax=Petrolisthes cinctipes TaxID=88211 RepID=A0AAE1F8H1_PETCI|nr:hypothetical protein Pcinc_025621 [Petrolisthes cinctipes]
MFGGPEWSQGRFARYFCANSLVLRLEVRNGLCLLSKGRVEGWEIRVKIGVTWRLSTTRELACGWPYRAFTTLPYPSPFPSTPSHPLSLSPSPPTFPLPPRPPSYTPSIPLTSTSLLIISPSATLSCSSCPPTYPYLPYYESKPHIPSPHLPSPPPLLLPATICCSELPSLTFPSPSPYQLTPFHFSIQSFSITDFPIIFSSPLPLLPRPS